MEAAFGVGLEQLHLRGSPTVTENATRAWVRRETITHGGPAMRVWGGRAAEGEGADLGLGEGRGDGSGKKEHHGA